MKNKKAFSLIETLVVISVFAILATVATQSTLLSLRGARKVDSASEVRENLDFAMSIMERLLKNAQSITSTCDTGADLNAINYVDQDKFNTSFKCLDSNGDGKTDYVASGSAALTNSNINLTECSFRCSKIDVNSPPYVDIKLSGQQKNAGAADQNTVSVETRVNLRVY